MQRDPIAPHEQRLPRSAWRSHPNYPRQALLLGSHDNFRRISTHLVSESMRHWSAAPQRAPSAPLLSLFKRWKSAMKGHEGYEEGKLYPYLHARYGVSMTLLEHQHRLLGLAEDRVLSAHRAGDSLAAAHAFKKHDEVLVPHLAREEDMVIPLLLAMSPAEFDRYSGGNIARLLTELAKDRAVHNDQR